MVSVVLWLCFINKVVNAAMLFRGLSQVAFIHFTQYSLNFFKMLSGRVKPYPGGSNGYPDGSKPYPGRSRSYPDR